MKLITIIITMFIFTNFNIFAGFLVNEEIYYDAGKTKVLGKKVFNYDELQNIVSIVSYSQNSTVESKLEYIYENGLLVKCNEYRGSSIIKYSIFTYNNDKNVISKEEKNDRDELILVNKYNYEGKVLKSIGIYTQNKLIGTRTFDIKNNAVVLESQLDAKGSLMNSKKYTYTGDLLTGIEYISSTGAVIRIVDRKYLKTASPTNMFGLKSNFIDFR